MRQKSVIKRCQETELTLIIQRLLGMHWESKEGDGSGKNPAKRMYFETKIHGSWNDRQMHKRSSCYGSSMYFGDTNSSSREMRGNTKQMQEATSILSEIHAEPFDDETPTKHATVTHANSMHATLLRAT
eukprot:6208913-Pleurochrysis_carterae.AAC.1